MSASLPKFAQKLFRLRLEVWVALEEILDECGLSVSDWLILHTLNEAENGLTMSELSSQQGVLPPAVTRIMKDIVNRSFVYRIPNPEDDRSVIVGLTPIGIKKLNEAERKLEPLKSSIDRRIARGDWRDINNYLAPLIDARSLLQNIRLCVLQVGDNNPGLRRGVPSFEKLFRSMFDPFPQIEPEFIKVHKGTLPKDLDEWDAFLITGGARLDDNPNWVAPLRSLIKDINKSGKPLIGICFGHQIIADTLGGKSEPTEEWGLGMRKVGLHNRPEFIDGIEKSFNLLYYHREQVSKAPRGATIFAGDSYCPIAAFHIGSRILSFQGHPEFTPEVVDATMEYSKETIGTKSIKRARKTLNEQDDAIPVTASIVNFIEKALPPPNHA